MNKLKVTISNKQKTPIDEQMRAVVRSCCAQVLSDEKIDFDCEVTVTFVDDKRIHEMNREFRSVDRPTDVLSFPLGENGEYDINPETNLYSLGDVVISAETAARQAKDYGHSLEREIAFLTVHSMLHLLGYDHMEPDEEAVMREKQEKALTALGITRETEQEKMLSGQLYDPTDEELLRMRTEAHRLCAKINAADPEDRKKIETLLRKLIPDMGSEVYIEPPFRADYGRFIEIGDSTYINFNMTALDCAHISIGKDCFFGPNVTIVPPVHPMKYQNRNMRRRGRALYDLEAAKPVTIGDNCWIASSVTICGGVTIGDGCVIAAGSVVTKDIPAGMFAAGNPCRVITSVDEYEF